VIEDQDVDVEDLGAEEVKEVEVKEEEVDEDTENLSVKERIAPEMRDNNGNPEESAGDLPNRDARDDALIAGTILVVRSPEETEEITREKLTIATLVQAAEITTQYDLMITEELQQQVPRPVVEVGVVGRPEEG